MNGCLHSVKSRLALVYLLAACIVLGSTGCATTSPATSVATAPPAPERVAEPPPTPEPEAEPPPPPPRPARAERRKGTKRAVSRSAASTEVKTPVAARTPETRRPQMDGASTTLSATTSEPVPFEPAVMTRPQRVSGREPQLTPEARAEHVRGTALVRCVVTREGRVTRCRLLNGLPYMEQELLEALSTWQVTPVTSEGKPLDVDYTFVVRIPAA